MIFDSVLLVRSSMRKSLSVFFVCAFVFGGLNGPLGALSISAQTNTTQADRDRRVATGDKPVSSPSTDFCDPSFVGAPIGFSSATSLTMNELLDQIHRRFGVSFLVEDKIGDIPINVKAENVPWNVLLNSQLYISGIRARCLDAGIIQLAFNSSVPKMQDTAEITTKVIKLKFLQPASTGSVDLAGRTGANANRGCAEAGDTQGAGTGCGNFEKLVIEIERILGLKRQASGGQSTEEQRPNRSMTQIPGRNILVVRGSKDEVALIEQVVAIADRAPFQVVIKGLIYTVNESKARDVGVSRIGATDLVTPPIPSTIPTNPNTLRLGNLSGSGFDVSAIVGTIQFGIEASALEASGAISVKSRPFAVVLDGEKADLDVGRQLPIAIQGGLNTAGQLQIIQASNILSITPYVIDDEDGKPVAVNLSVQIESNDVDRTVVVQGLPAVNRRSIQTRLVIDQEQTVILGGFTIDSESDEVSKTIGLGDIPLIGNLFKRKVKKEETNRLYFAISVSVVPYGENLKSVDVPGASTEVRGLPTRQ